VRVRYIGLPAIVTATAIEYELAFFFSPHRESALNTHGDIARHRCEDEVLGGQGEEVERFHEFPMVFRAVEPVKCRDLFRAFMGDPSESISVEFVFGMEVIIVSYGAPLCVHHGVIEG